LRVLGACASISNPAQASVMGNKLAREFRSIGGHDSGDEHHFTKGDKVEALFHGRVWSPGKIETVNEDGSYVVAWDNGSNEDKIKQPDQILNQTEADHSLMREKMNLEAAFRELHGIHELQFLGVVAILGSVCIVGYGASHTGLDLMEKLFLVLAAAFLVKTSLCASTTMRNSSWNDVQDHRGRPLPGEALIVGECVGGWMSYFSFFTAMFCACFGVYLMDLEPAVGEFQDKMLFVFGFLVLTCSVVVVSVTLGDQGDADVWMTQANPEGNQSVPHSVVTAVTRNLVCLARASRCRMISFFAFATVLSIVLWLIGLTQHSISPHKTGETFMIMAYLFFLLTTAVLARAIEIEEDSHPETGEKAIRTCRCCPPPKSVIFAFSAWCLAAGLTAFGFTRTHAHFFALRMLIVGTITSAYTTFHLVLYIYKGRTVDHIDTSPSLNYEDNSHH